MMTIWKYKLDLEGRQPIVLKMPAGARPLDVQIQGDDICLWAVVDTKRELELRPFWIFGTGHVIPESHRRSLHYLATFQMLGSLVFHVFEQDPYREVSS